MNMNRIPYNVLTWRDHVLYPLLSECNPLFKNVRRISPSEFRLYDIEKNFIVTRLGDFVKLYLIIESYEDLNIYHLFPLVIKYTLKIGVVELTYDYHTLLLHYITKRLEINKYRSYNDKSILTYKYVIDLPIGINSEKYISLLPLQYVNVRIDIETEKQIVIHENNNDEFNDEMWKKLPYELAMKIISFHNDESQKVNAKIGCDHVFISHYQRVPIAQSPHVFEWEHLIVFGNGITNSPITLHNVDCVKYILFFVHSGKYFNPNEFKNIDPITSTLLKIGNINTYGGDGEIYNMRILRPKQILSIELPVGIYMIPFCGPEEGFLPLLHYQPMTITVNSHKEYNVTVCGLNLNVLHITSGLCALKLN